MKEQMVEQGFGDAWDEVEFDEVFDLFEEDDPNDESAKDENKMEGLDKAEFTKLVKRIAQL